MHIIFMILKILGIVILCILGLVLLLLLLILLSPLSYQVSGVYHKGKKPKGKATVSYLLHMLRVQAVYREDSFKLRVKLLWFTIFRTGSSAGEPDAADAGGTPEEDSQKDETAAGTAVDDAAAGEPDSDTAAEDASAETESADALTVELHTEETLSGTEAEELASEETLSGTEAVVPSADGDGTEEGPASTTEAGSTIVDHDFSEEPQVITSEQEKTKAQQKDEDAGFIGKLTKTWDKLQEFYDLLQKPSMEKMLKRITRRVKKILKALLPSSLDVDLALGLSDPRTMGRCMEVYAVLFALYGEHIRFFADFEKERIDVKGRLKGYLIPGYLVWQVICIAAAVLLQKECRQFVLGRLFHKEA